LADGDLTTFCVAKRKKGGEKTIVSSSNKNNTKKRRKTPAVADQRGKKRRSSSWGKKKIQMWEKGRTGEGVRCPSRYSGKRGGQGKLPIIALPSKGKKRVKRRKHRKRCELSFARLG